MSSAATMKPSAAAAPKRASNWTNPAYKKGVLSVIPKTWVPYFELMRFELPHGYYLGYFPLLVGIMYGASAGPARMPASELAFQALLYAGWCFCMRGAGCAWNDNTDQEFDRKTERCRTRPIARGAVSTFGGHVFAFVMTTLGYLCLAPLPEECQNLGTAVIMLSILYPFCKRFTNFAQVILGITLALNFILAAYGAGLPALEGAYKMPTTLVTIAITLLVVFYDVVYARVDTADDLKSGVKGMAVLFRNYIEVLLAALTCTIGGLLAATGIYIENGPYYFLFSVVGLTVALAAMVAGIRYRVFSTWNSYSGWFYVLAIVNLMGGYAIEYAGNTPIIA
jgi:4-hydroxybenzoate polyprenyltransferase